MKTKLQKNRRDLHIYWPVILVLLVAVAFVLYVALSDNKDWSSLTPLIPILLLIKLRYDPYYITDNNQLLGNGVIMIPFIQCIEQKEKGGLRVYYVRMKGGVVRDRSFYPGDEQLFIDTLLEINPNIKLY